MKLMSGLTKIGKMETTTKANLFWFTHDKDAKEDFKIKLIRKKHGLAGYAMYFMTLESMMENYTGTMPFDMIEFTAMMIEVDKEIYQQFLDDCVTVGLFIKNDTCYYSERFYHDFCKARDSSLRKKSSAKERHARERDEKAALETDKDDPPPKTPKPKKEKTPDIESTPEIDQLRKHVDAIFEEYPDTVNPKNELTNQQYLKLIEKFGYSKLALMQRFYYEWKFARKAKTTTTDFGTLNRSGGWVEERANEELIKQGKPINKPPSQEPWTLPFPKPPEWDSWHNDQKLTYRKQKMQEMSR